MKKRFENLFCAVLAISLVIALFGCATPKASSSGTPSAVSSVAQSAAESPAASSSQPSESASGSAGAADGSEGFVLLSDVIPDAIQEIRYYSTYNFVGARVDGYEEPCALLTKEAAAALKEASDEFKDMGYRLKIYDAYRPQMAVDHFVRWAEDLNDTAMKSYFYPDIDKNALFVMGYIDQKSGHSRGSSIDLTLFDMKTGKEVDMGGTFDYFGELSHPTYSKGLTDEQVQNRRTLREVMSRHSFQPIPTEWWHFDLTNEPYPDTYFNFPVSAESVAKN
ncbi:MAG: M15 family metallopeptidase [Oscillospiraceae bacterium]|nr:M15 family metallopeptidase [Oscillospiraceae bacterium]